MKIPRRRFLHNAGQSFAALALAPPALPQSPSPAASQPRVTLNVRDFRAQGDGAAKDTAAFQQAIDRCSVLGGGQVLVPPGSYLTGALALRSRVTLRLEKDAVLTGSPDFADYPVSQVRWEGKWIPGRVALLYAFDAVDIAVIGPGKISGNPALGGRPNAANPLRHPSLIEPIGCRGIRLEDFSTEYRLMWSIHPTNCEDIVIRNLTIRSTGGNGDGIDIDSCRHVLIDSCDIATGDDCISLKSGRGSEAWALRQTTEDVRIVNCTMADSIFACIGIGSETSGGIRNVRIERCKFTRAQTFALYIKSRPGRGAFIEDITATDLDVSGVTGGFLRFNLLNSGIQDQVPVPGLEGIPTACNFRFSRVRVSACPLLVDGVNVHPGKPLDGLLLDDITGTCAKGIRLSSVRNAEIRGVRLEGLSGPLLALHDVTGKGLEGAESIPGPAVPPDIPAPAEPYVVK